MAATLAAYTAKGNHREQLQHDRAMREDEHTRELLDTIVERAQELFWAVRRWDNELVEMEAKRVSLQARLASGLSEEATNSLQVERQDNEEAITQSVSNANQHAIEMNLDTIRLILRLGDDHAIVGAHEELKDAVEAAVDMREIAKTRNRTKEKLVAAEESSEDGKEKLGVFLAACRDWFIDPEPANRRASHGAGADKG